MPWLRDLKYTFGIGTLRKSYRLSIYLGAVSKVAELPSLTLLWKRQPREKLNTTVYNRYDFY